MKGSEAHLDRHGKPDGVPGRGREVPSSRRYSRRMTQWEYMTAPVLVHDDAAEGLHAVGHPDGVRHAELQLPRLVGRRIRDVVIGAAGEHCRGGEESQ